MTGVGEQKPWVGGLLHRDEGRQEESAYERLHREAKLKCDHVDIISAEQQRHQGSLFHSANDENIPPMSSVHGVTKHQHSRRYPSERRSGYTETLNGNSYHSSASERNHRSHSHQSNNNPQNYLPSHHQDRHMSHQGESHATVSRHGHESSHSNHRSTRRGDFQESGSVGNSGDVIDSDYHSNHHRVGHTETSSHSRYPTDGTRREHFTPVDEVSHSNYYQSDQRVSSRRGHPTQELDSYGYPVGSHRGGHYYQSQPPSNTTSSYNYNEGIHNRHTHHPNGNPIQMNYNRSGFPDHHRSHRRHNPLRGTDPYGSDFYPGIGDSGGGETDYRNANNNYEFHSNQPTLYSTHSDDGHQRRKQQVRFGEAVSVEPSYPNSEEIIIAVDDSDDEADRTPLRDRDRNQINKLQSQQSFADYVVEVSQSPRKLRDAQTSPVVLDTKTSVPPPAVFGSPTRRNLQSNYPVESSPAKHSQRALVNSEIVKKIESVRSIDDVQQTTPITTNLKSKPVVDNNNPTQQVQQTPSHVNCVKLNHNTNGSPLQREAVVSHSGIIHSQPNINSPVQPHTIFVKAAAQGDIARLRSVAKEITPGSDESGKALLMSVIGNHLPVVSALLRSGISDLNYVHNTTKRTALHLASILRHHEIINFLLSGKNGDQLLLDINQKDVNNLTPLMYAVGGNRYGLLPKELTEKSQITLTGPIVSVKEEEGESQIIVIKGVEFSLEGDLFNTSSLNEAGLRKIIEIINKAEPTKFNSHIDFNGQFFDEQNAAVGITDDAGFHTTELLLSAGADPSITDFYGRSAVYYCITGGWVDKLEILKQSMAGFSQVSNDVEGKGPIHWACQEKSHECLQIVLSDCKHNCNTTDYSNRSPFSLLDDTDVCCKEILLEDVDCDGIGSCDRSSKIKPLQVLKSIPYSCFGIAIVPGSLFTSRLLSMVLVDFKRCKSKISTSSYVGFLIVSLLMAVISLIIPVLVVSLTDPSTISLKIMFGIYLIPTCVILVNLYRKVVVDGCFSFGFSLLSKVSCNDVYKIKKLSNSFSVLHTVSILVRLLFLLSVVGSSINASFWTKTVGNPLLFRFNDSKEISFYVSLILVLVLIGYAGFLIQGACRRDSNGGLHFQNTLSSKIYLFVSHAMLPFLVNGIILPLLDCSASLESCGEYSNSFIVALGGFLSYLVVSIVVPYSIYLSDLGILFWVDAFQVVVIVGFRELFSIHVGHVVGFVVSMFCFFVWKKVTNQKIEKNKINTKLAQDVQRVNVVSKIGLFSNFSVGWLSFLLIGIDAAPDSHEIQQAITALIFVGLTSFIVFLSLPSLIIFYKTVFSSKPSDLSSSDLPPDDMMSSVCLVRF